MRIYHISTGAVDGDRHGSLEDNNSGLACRSLDPSRVLSGLFKILITTLGEAPLGRIRPAAGRAGALRESEDSEVARLICLSVSA